MENQATITLSAAVKATVGELEEKHEALAMVVMRTEQTRDYARERARDIYEGLNIRERHLRAWFGGDKEKRAQYDYYSGHAETFTERLSNQQEQLDGLVGKIRQTIHAELSLTDPAYQQMLVPWNAAKTLNDAVADYKALANTALAEVREAHHYVMGDIGSHNAGIVFPTNLANGKAVAAVNNVRDITPAFNEAAKDYSAAMKNEALAGIRLAFNGVDATKPVELYQLNRAAAEIDLLLPEVAKIEAVAQTDFAQAEETVSTYIDQARIACRM